MSGEKLNELGELTDELEIILSVKDSLSMSEVENLKNKYLYLSEEDIIQKIEELTGKVVDDENKIIDDIDVQNKENINGSKNEIINEIKEENRLDVQAEEIIYDEDNIPEVTFVKGEIKYGQLSIEWGWPNGIKKVKLCCRMDRFPQNVNDPQAMQIEIERVGNSEKGSYIINKVSEGNYYFTVFTSAKSIDKVITSQGQRRLIVNKVPDNIYYNLKVKSSILGKIKSVQIELSVEKDELDIPQLVLVGKVGSMPIQKSDGEIIMNTDYNSVKTRELLSIDVPVDSIKKNMYVKLFFLDDNNSKLFRIVSPSNESLYIK